ncbi:UPF0496 protein At3g49070-like [Pistacia vera]|uniref:UPF0496 protein At3g49070-like n=1 Tax=Pistacia vera TaxID=55513 RepID=UPI0012634A4F|nr:UPF0496 protein At3g49070-like [Pistacia vera]
MLSRLLPKRSHFRLITHLYSKSQPYPQNPYFSPLLNLCRFLSTNNNDNNNNSKDPSTSNPWNLSRENEGKFDSLFNVLDTELRGGSEDVFSKSGGDWMAPGSTEEEYKPWSFVEEKKDDDVFDLGEGVRPVDETLGENSASIRSEMTQEEKEMLEREEKELSAIVKGSGGDTSDQQTGLDVREEYAHAFRTESYNEFWTRVLALTNGNSTTKCIPIESTTAARLSSYRLFAEQLLDPDQPTVTRILSLKKAHSLLTNYFSQTAEASLLCSLLFKNIDNIREKYQCFKTVIQSLENAHFLPSNNLLCIITRLTELSNLSNPLTSSAPSHCRVRIIQAGCLKLLKQFESSRDKARTKLRLINASKHGSAIFLVALTASLTVIVASHALALLIVAPSLIAASVELTSTRRLARVSTQLDVAAKGTYILNRDLDTISRLVARLNDELEHMRSMVKFWLERGEGGRLQASGEVARQLKKNDASFSQQLDDLEEHLYLCFMTINRSRNLVLKEILDPSQPSSHPGI